MPNSVLINDGFKTYWEMNIYIYIYIIYIYCIYGVNIEWILVSFLVLNLIIFLNLFKIIGS